MTWLILGEFVSCPPTVTLAVSELSSFRGITHTPSCYRSWCLDFDPGDWDELAGGLIDCHLSQAHCRGYWASDLLYHGPRVVHYWLDGSCVMAGPQVYDWAALVRLRSELGIVLGGAVSWPWVNASSHCPQWVQRDLECLLSVAPNPSLAAAHGMGGLIGQ